MVCGVDAVSIGQGGERTAAHNDEMMRVRHAQQTVALKTAQSPADRFNSDAKMVGDVCA
jgi:hypothetical protein